MDAQAVVDADPNVRVTAGRRSMSKRSPSGNTAGSRLAAPMPKMSGVPAGIATPFHTTSARLRRGNIGTGGLQRTPSSTAAAHSPAGSATNTAEPIGVLQQQRVDRAAEAEIGRVGARGKQELQERKDLGVGEALPIDLFRVASFDNKSSPGLSRRSFRCGMTKSSNSCEHFIACA